MRQEIKFNNQVSCAFRGLRSFNEDLQHVQTSLTQGKALESAISWEAVHSRLNGLDDNNARRIIQDHVEHLHRDILAEAESSMNRMFKFGREENRWWMEVSQGSQSLTNDVKEMPPLPDTKSSPVELDGVIATFERLGSLDVVTKVVSRSFDRYIAQPITSSTTNEHAFVVNITGNRLELSPTTSKKDVYNVLDIVSKTLEFLHYRLPSRIRIGVASAINPNLVSILVRTWLVPFIPIELSDLPGMEALQKRTSQLAELISQFGWPGDQELLDWIEIAPRLWLAKRGEASLDGIRKALSTTRGPSRQVERVESQTISDQDDAFAVNGRSGEWDDDGSKASKAVSSSARLEDDDVDGWGFEDDKSGADQVHDTTNPAENTEDDESADAWGWDEETQGGIQGHASTTESKESREKPGNGIYGKSSASREITLRESYTITDLPDYVLEIIGKDVRDAEIIKESQTPMLKSISPSTGLLKLPTFVLAMFRSVAPSYYTSTLRNGNMHLYNDCMYIVGKLGDVIASETVGGIRSGCVTLEKFAKTAYTREMEVQRTILSDLLDGAQGFTSCTQFPFSSQCETAVSSVVDRIRDVQSEWRLILSHSALLQSIGSLISTIIDKIINDIEDMEDISEPESQRLALFCNQVSELSDLFMSDEVTPVQSGDGHEPITLIAVYVHNWLRFQYMANILESSLVDIKYLWADGELSLEFSADEVIDMIKALFAESTHRRNTVADIRRSNPSR